MAALAFVLVLGIGAGLAWSNRDYLGARAVELAEMVWPKVLSAEAERALPPGQSFKECAPCPELVVVPTGEFMMGSPNEEKGHERFEEPQRKVYRVCGSKSGPRNGTPACSLAAASGRRPKPAGDAAGGR